MSLVRNSPSGPTITFDADVLSVFGRVGAVVAEPGDYGSSLIDNDSTVPGASLTDALDALSGTDGIQNESGVSGATVSAALDTLAALAPAAAGSIHDTFIGGALGGVSVVSNTNAGIGDRGWNWAIIGVATGSSGVQRTGENGALGIFRITAGTNINTGANIYLSTLGAPPFRASEWAECTWRARFDSGQAANERCSLGMLASGSGTLASGVAAAGFFGQQLGAGSNANYQSCTGFGGSAVFKNTGVPIDAFFHDFRIRRVDATTIQFYIDGVLVTTHTSPTDPVPSASSALTAFAGALSGGTPTFTDVDDFIFIPA